MLLTQYKRFGVNALAFNGAGTLLAVGLASLLLIASVAYAVQTFLERSTAGFPELYDAAAAVAAMNGEAADPDADDGDLFLTPEEEAEREAAARERGPRVEVEIEPPSILDREDDAGDDGPEEVP